MIEAWWRKTRHERLVRKYRKLEEKAGSSDEFGYFEAWFGGVWPDDMVAQTPTCVLKTRPYMAPPIDEGTRIRIDQELARRRSSRAQTEARISIVIAFGSLVVAWLAN